MNFHNWMFVESFSWKNERLTAKLVRTRNIKEKINIRVENGIEVLKHAIFIIILNTSLNIFQLLRTIARLWDSHDGNWYMKNCTNDGIRRWCYCSSCWYECFVIIPKYIFGGVITKKKIWLRLNLFFYRIYGNSAIVRFKNKSYIIRKQKYLHGVCVSNIKGK